MLRRALAALLLPLSVAAQPIEERTDTLQHVRAKVVRYKDRAATVGCGLHLENVRAGERITLRAWVPMSNNTRRIFGRDGEIVIGVTTEVLDCTTSCYPSQLRFAPHSSEYGGGNITPDMHHAVHWAFATWRAEYAEPFKDFKAIVYPYSSQPKGWLDLHGCHLVAEREAP